MVNIVGGSDILDQGASIANQAVQNAIALGNSAGWMRPSSIGATGNQFLPTLGNLQLQEQQRTNTNSGMLDIASLMEQARQSTNAGRISIGGLAETQRGNTMDYGLNRGNLQLGVANSNANQRVAQASAQQGMLNLLATLRGPSNAVAYNSLLNNVGAPVGQQVDPFAIFRQIYQPTDWSSVDPGAALSPGALPTLENPAAPPQLQQAQAPQAPGYDTNWGTQVSTGPPSARPPVVPPPVQPRVAGPAPSQGGGGGGAHPAYLPTSGVPVNVSQEDYSYAESVFNSYATPAEQQAAATSPTTGAVMTSADLAAYTAVSHAAPSEAANWLRENGFLGAGKGAKVKRPKGSKAPDATVIGGEAGPEVVVGSDFEVIPISQGMDLISKRTPQAATGGAVQNGVFNAQTQGQPDLLSGVGNPFDFTTYGQGQIAALPGVQKLTGGMPSRAFGGTLLDMQIPGTQQRLPMGFNVSKFSALMPSERQLIQGLYETPRALGGLGLDFQDVQEQSRRAAPIGSGGGGQTFYG